MPASLAPMVNAYPVATFFCSLMVKPAYLPRQRHIGTVNGLFWPDGSVVSLKNAPDKPIGHRNIRSTANDGVAGGRHGRFVEMCGDIGAAFGDDRGDVFRRLHLGHPRPASRPANGKPVQRGADVGRDVDLVRHDHRRGVTAPGDDLLGARGVADGTLIERALDAVVGKVLAGPERGGERVMLAAPAVESADADTERLGDLDVRRAVAAQALGDASERGGVG